MINRIVYILLVLSYFFIAGCSGTSKLPEDAYLYTGAKFEIESPETIDQKARLMDKMDAFLLPEPNLSIFGMRPKLWFYNLYDTVEKEKGFKYWVKYKLGEPPVLLSNVEQDRVSSNLKLALENNGFFNAEVESEAKIKKKTASVIYTGIVEKPYSFGEIHLPANGNSLARAIKAKGISHIQKGERFNLEDLDNERLKLEVDLQNQGFYYFNDTYLLYRIDSTVGERKVEVFMTLKPETPEQAKITQQISEVSINTQFELYDSLSVSEYDTVQVDSIIYISKTPEFRPEIIASHIRLRENNLYTREAEEITISRLVDLNVFQYVNVTFEDAGRGRLNAKIRTTPMKKKSLQLELRGITKSNSFVGPAFRASFRNRNFLRGAELYQLTLNAGYEWQIGPQTSGQALNSYELGITNSLSIPRFITPFKINYYSSRFVPQTNLKLGFRLLKRVDYFQLNSFDFSYGFRWRDQIKITHRLNPVDISYIRLSNTSDAFKELLHNNTYLQRSYENQFILGSSYGYIYNTQARPESSEDLHNFYFNANLDISGNIMHLIQNSVRSTENTDENPYTIFGSAYSQFVRTDFDFRHYFRLNRGSKIASRFILGVGKAFGNSTVLPYTKQFSIGGSSSVRAFRARALGPGSFAPADSTNSTIFFDQTADIKIETNVEYRFDLAGSFKGAVFVDAGNIWSFREDENREGGQFSSKSFLGELAVGAGVGLRLDIDFFVLRLDFATPVKVPSNEVGNRWQLRLRDTDPNTGEKYNNIVLNIAIGYPF